MSITVVIAQSGHGVACRSTPSTVDDQLLERRLIRRPRRLAATRGNTASTRRAAGPVAPVAVVVARVGRRDDRRGRELRDRDVIGMAVRAVGRERQDDLRDAPGGSARRSQTPRVGFARSSCCILVVEQRTRRDAEHRGRGTQFRSRISDSAASPGCSGLSRRRGRGIVRGRHAWRSPGRSRPPRWRIARDAAETERLVVGMRGTTIKRRDRVISLRCVQIQLTSTFGWGLTLSRHRPVRRTRL